MNDKNGKIESIEHREVLRGAGVVGFFILGSRLLGYLRDAILAHFFGARALMDVFVVAFRIPNTLRRLFAEGSLTIAFVPIFSEKLHRDSKTQAKEFFDTIFTLVTLVLILLSILGVVFAPAVVWLFAQGFAVDKFELAVFCTRIIFPYILFISLVACAMGTLNSLRHFSAPAAAGMVLNVCIILAVIYLPKVVSWSQLTCACVGVIVGGVFQLALQLPFLKAQGFFPRPRFQFKDPGIRRFLYLMAPAIFGSAVYQINILILTRFASQMPGANSYLYYADRIFQLPLALFGISVATSALPSFSRLVAKKDQKGFAETFSFAIRAVLFIVLPAMAGLIALRLGIVQSLFQGGQFHWADTVETARALLYFSFGLVAVSGVRVAVAGFNAHQDTKTPVKVAVVSLLTNIFACWYLMKFMGSSGLALAVTLSSVVNFSLLLWILNQKFGPLGGRRMISAGLRISALALLMGILIGFLSQQIAWEEGGRSLVKVGALFGLILVGMAFYFAGAYILRFPEMREFLDRRKK